MVWQRYYDIRDQLGEPCWHDEHGVPRYREFTPRGCANIYAWQAALVEVQCQHCSRIMRVAMTSEPGSGRALREKLAGRWCRWGYGDMPDHGCLAGETMNAETVRVVEFWERDVGRWKDWERVPSLEGPINEPA